MFVDLWLCQSCIPPIAITNCSFCKLTTCVNHIPSLIKLEMLALFLFVVLGAQPAIIIYNKNNFICVNTSLRTSISCCSEFVDLISKDRRLLFIRSYNRKKLDVTLVTLSFYFPQIFFKDICCTFPL